MKFIIGIYLGSMISAALVFASCACPIDLFSQDVMVTLKDSSGRPMPKTEIYPFVNFLTGWPKSERIPKTLTDSAGRVSLDLMRYYYDERDRAYHFAIMAEDGFHHIVVPCSAVHGKRLVLTLDESTRSLPP